MMRYSAVLLLMGGLVLAGASVMSGCNSNTEKVDRSRPAADARQETRAPAAQSQPERAENAGGGTHASSNGLAWEVPSGFRQEAPANTMRVAQYRIPSGRDGVKDGELVVFFFGPGQGGGTQDNLARWAGQFKQDDGSDPMQKANIETFTSSGGMKVTTIELSGHYESSMMGGGPSYNEPGWRLYGAVVEGEGGPWFFKAVGPEDVMLQSKGQLLALFKGLHAAHS